MLWIPKNFFKFKLILKLDKERRNVIPEMELIYLKIV
jgi:hypothetical protein